MLDDTVSLYLHLSPDIRRDLASKFQLVQEVDGTERDEINLAHRWLRRASESGTLDAEFGIAVQEASRAAG